MCLGTVVAFVALLTNAYAVDPLVQISQGLVRGVRSEDGQYSMFMGIPYAQVDPNKPFGDPIAAPSFSSVFEANDDSVFCPQIEEFNNTIAGELDCLTVNVYVPLGASSIKRLPVMVWIYGGGFFIGLAGRYSHGPKFLVQHDIILVTLNYRLGPYGFMCLGNAEAPGNAGLKDQKAALRWVKNNIAAFGGDDENITIFGESAGGASAELQILFQNNENLFQRAILQSGTAIFMDLKDELDSSKLLELSLYLGKDTDVVDDALQYLSTFNPYDIIKAANDLSISFQPCVEHEVANVEAFMTRFPLEVLISANYTQVPIIMGIIETEKLGDVVSAISNDPKYMEGFAVIMEDAIYKYIKSVNELDLKSVVNTAKHFYFEDRTFSDNITSEIIDFYTDITFGHATERSLRYHLRNSNPVYYYIFSFSSLRNYVKYRRNITVGGATHADEISYLFEQSYYTEGVTDEEQIVIDYMTTLWTNFAKYGIPTPESSNLPYWPPITADTRPAMWFDKDLQVVNRPFAQRYAFWDLIFTVE